MIQLKSQQEQYFFRDKSISQACYKMFLSLAMSSLNLGKTFLTLLKNESYEGLRVPLVIEVALKREFHATLEELAVQKKEEENPNAKFISDTDILKTIQNTVGVPSLPMFESILRNTRVINAVLRLALPAAERTGHTECLPILLPSLEVALKGGHVQILKTLSVMNRLHQKVRQSGITRSNTKW